MLSPALSFTCVILTKLPTNEHAYIFPTYVYVYSYSFSDLFAFRLQCVSIRPFSHLPSIYECTSASSSLVFIDTYLILHRHRYAILFFERFRHGISLLCRIPRDIGSSPGHRQSIHFHQHHLQHPVSESVSVSISAESTSGSASTSAPSYVRSPGGPTPQGVPSTSGCRSGLSPIRVLL